MQRFGYVRLGHLHLSSLPHAWHRGVRARGAAGRRRTHHRTTARRAARWARSPSSTVYNARKRQVGGDRRFRVLRAHRVRGGRAGRALPAADAGRIALAGHHEDRPLRVHVQHEVRRDHFRPASTSARACPIPPEMVPPDAQVEIAAKIAAGYLTTDEAAPDPARTSSGATLRNSDPRAAQCGCGAPQFGCTVRPRHRGSPRGLARG